MTTAPAPAPAAITASTPLTGRRVLVPGGTGAVGEGVVRAYLAARAEVVESLGGVDDVVAPIGGWWAGKALWEVDGSDWENAFVGLATTHLAIARAALPHLGADGAYSVVVGLSAHHPVPSSGLVSMEQAAVLMMQRVLAAEAGARSRVFALVLGPVRSRAAAGEPDWVSADEVGAVAVGLSTDPTQASREVVLGDSPAARAVLEQLAR